MLKEHTLSKQAIVRRLVLLPALLLVFSPFALAQNVPCCDKNAESDNCCKKSVFDFNVTSNNGDTVKLSQYADKVLLIVNTATHCGFTPQYEELQRLHEQYAEKGLIILDFPCNQFGAQAPGSAEEIYEFCSANFHIGFPQMEKADVNGPDELPLFAFLKECLPFHGFNLQDERGAFMDQMLRKQDPSYDKKADIKWNFTKFLVNRNGKPVRRFEPTESIEDVEQGIRNELQ